METEQNTQYKKESVFMHFLNGIKDWFVTKALRIRDKVVAYFTSKDTWKTWKRRLIFIGVIVLIILSFRVKEYFDIYPYDKESYLSISIDRQNVTNYDGATDFSRLVEFSQNVQAQKEDSLRVVSTINGYTVTEDLKAEIVDGTLRITLTTDNTKNKMLDKSKRIKEVEEFEGFTVTLEGGWRIFKLTGGNDGREYKFASYVMYS